jgi:dienelactone hydrolase
MDYNAGMKYLISFLLSIMPALAVAEDFVKVKTAEGVPLTILASQKHVGTVILAHSCQGVNMEHEGKWAKALAEEGFTVVIFDSWEYRKFSVQMPCHQVGGFDGALRIEEVQIAINWIHAEKISGPIHLIGFSNGGSAALHASVMENISIAKIVAFYPPCSRAFAETKRPVQIHVGTADKVTPAAKCKDVYSEQNRMASIFEYDEAKHGFDYPRATASKDLAAAKQAFIRVVAFLKE